MDSLAGPIRIRQTKTTHTTSLCWSLDAPSAERRFRLRDSVDRRERHGHRHQRERDRPVRVRRTRWRELGLVQMDPPSNGTAHFHIGMDWLTIEVYTGSTIGGLTRVATSSGSPSTVNMDSSGGHNLPDTPHQKHADIGLSFTLDALNRDMVTTQPL